MLDFAAMAKLRDIEQLHAAASSAATSWTSPIRSPGATRASRRALASLCAEAVDAVKGGHNILIVTDRRVDADAGGDPGAAGDCRPMHQHLVRDGLRTTTGLVVETGSAREVHHFALLAGYGAEAIHPYLAMETLADMRQDLSGRPVAGEGRLTNYIKAIGKGLTKIMSKMGISTYMSLLRRADLRGRRPEQRDWSTSTSPAPPADVEGIGVFEVAEEAIRLHKRGLRRRPGAGQHARRRRRIRLAHARRRAHVDARRHRQAAAHARAPTTGQHLQGIRADHQRPEPPPHDAARPVRVQDRSGASAIPLDEVEPAKDIVKRFATGAMSLGSITHRGARRRWPWP